MYSHLNVKAQIYKFLCYLNLVTQSFKISHTINILLKFTAFYSNSVNFISVTFTIIR